MTTTTKPMCKGAETGQCDRPARRNGSGGSMGWCYAHLRRIDRDGDPHLEIPVKRTNKGRSGIGWGDDNYRGNGLLTCRCGRPYAEHEIAERCYEVGRW